jgi:hypothetical protein
MQSAKARASDLWPVRLYNIFRHYLMNGAIFEKVIERKICVLIFSTTFV